MKSNLLITLALPLVVSALAACGTEDDPSSGSASELTEKDSPHPGDENGICGGIGGFACKPGLVCEGVGDHPDAAGKCAAPPSDFCKDGTIESEPSYIASTDGKECRLESVHCITKDPTACPMLAPYSPDFCKDGTIESEPSYIASTDGKECKLPGIHCVTKDAKACPMP